MSVVGISPPGIAVILVEHVMTAVRALSSRHRHGRGAKIAEGPPEAVLREPEVVRAYLGDDDAETTASNGRHRALNDVAIRVRAGEVVAILARTAPARPRSSTPSPACSGPRAVRFATAAASRRPPPHPSLNRVSPPSPRPVICSVRFRLWKTCRWGRSRAMPARRRQPGWRMCSSFFPRLAEHRRQAVRTISGGEQQIVAVGRA